MNFDQGEFNFSASQSETGFARWREEQDERKRAFEVRWGVILGRRVRVQLVGERDPLEGMIHALSVKDPGNHKKLVLQMNKREFTAREIESIISLDDDESPPEE